MLKIFRKKVGIGVNRAKMRNLIAKSYFFCIKYAIIIYNYDCVHTLRRLL